MLIKFDLPKDPGETQNMLNETTNLRSLLPFCVNYIECHLKKSSSLIPPTTEWITPSNAQNNLDSHFSLVFLCFRFMGCVLSSGRGCLRDGCGILMLRCSNISRQLHCSICTSSFGWKVEETILQDHRIGWFIHPEVFFMLLLGGNLSSSGISCSASHFSI